MYCRECIYDYMLTKTQELKRQRVLYDRQQQEDAEKMAKEILAKGDAEVQSFLQANAPSRSRAGKVGGSSSSPAPLPSTSSTALVVVAATQPQPTATPGSKSNSGSGGSSSEAVVQHLKRKVDHTSREEQRETLKRTSFWVPEFAPKAGPDRVAEPPKRPSSPMTGTRLKLKELTPIQLTLDSAKENGVPGARGRILCAVSKREISNQPVVYLKKSGQMMLESVAKQLAYPDMLCPITGEQFKMKDILKLQSSGSSFAASGKVETKKYRPTMR